MIAEQHILNNVTSCCGQTILRSHLVPEFYGKMITCEPVGRLIRMTRFEWKDGLGAAHNALATLTADADPQVLAQVYLAHRSIKAPIPAAITGQAPTHLLIAATIAKDKAIAARAELGTSAKQNSGK